MEFYFQETFPREIQLLIFNFLFRCCRIKNILQYRMICKNSYISLLEMDKDLISKRLDNTAESLSIFFYYFLSRKKLCTSLFVRKLITFGKKSNEEIANQFLQKINHSKEVRSEDVYSRKHKTLQKILEGIGVREIKLLTRLFNEDVSLKTSPSAVLKNELKSRFETLEEYTYGLEILLYIFVLVDFRLSKEKILKKKNIKLENCCKQINITTFSLAESLIKIILEQANLFSFVCPKEHSKITNHVVKIVKTVIQIILERRCFLRLSFNKLEDNLEANDPKIVSEIRNKTLISFLYNDPRELGAFLPSSEIATFFYGEIMCYCISGTFGEGYLQPTKDSEERTENQLKAEKGVYSVDQRENQLIKERVIKISKELISHVNKIGDRTYSLYVYLFMIIVQYQSEINLLGKEGKYLDLIKNMIEESYKKESSRKRF